MIRKALRPLRRLLRGAWGTDGLSEQIIHLHQRLDEMREERRFDQEQANELREAIQHLQTELTTTHHVLSQFSERILDQQERARLTLGAVESRQLRLAGETNWKENQFQVYSQFGEDGLLQWLFREITPSRRFFVEFGVEDYREANTRFLLLKDRWTGLVMDGDPENVAAIQRDLAYFWRDLNAAAAFITRDNINPVLRENGTSGPIGLLCIDIDGNDYWVWEAITEVEPDVVVVEYNYRFGADIAAVVPYDPAFVKTTAHPSAIYYGASLKALCQLAERKGFALVGCSEGGVNAFFVRRDRLTTALPEVTPEQGYVAGQHAEMRDADGRVVKASLEEQKRLLLSLPLEYV